VMIFQCGFLYVALMSLAPTWSQLWKQQAPTEILPAGA